MITYAFKVWYNKSVTKGNAIVKNKCFTDKFVLTPQFAGVGSMEDYYDTKTEFDYDYD